MIASLQLFHDVPCRIMDLILSVITQPGFDAAQVTMLSSIDVIDIVEESRMKDRMAVVHNRSLGHDGAASQAGLSRFVLEEVLDIIHCQRMDLIRSKFEEALDPKSASSTQIQQVGSLKSMSLVHQSWTFSSQKALG